MAKTENFKISSMALSTVALLTFVLSVFLMVTGHWDLIGIIGMVLTAICFISSIALMDFLRRFERREGRRIRNASMTGRVEFMKHMRDRYKHILEKREGLSDIDALQRIIDFNRRKGFEQLNEIDNIHWIIMIPGSILVLCISIIFLFIWEWPENIFLTVVSIWALIIFLELRSLTKYKESSISLLEEELNLMHKEDWLAGV